MSIIRTANWAAGVENSSTPGNQPSGANSISRNRYEKPPIEAEMTTGIERTLPVIVGVVGVCLAIGLPVLGMLLTSGQPLSGSAASSKAALGMTVAIISLSLAGVGLVCWPFAHFYKRKLGTALKEVKAGNYLAHWTYSDAQWQSFVDDEEVVASTYAGTSMFVLGVMGVIMLFVLSGITTLAVRIGILAGTLILGYLLGKAVEWFQLQRLAKWRLNPWFAVIGPEGLFYNGTYHPFSIFGGGLDELNYVENDNMSYIVFTFMTQTREGTNYHDRRIPVPTGQEAQAKRIVSRLA